MSSDNVEILSFKSNLTAGDSFLSEPVILGQYISLSILSAASEDITVTLQFSADGINYDYSVTRNIYVGDNTIFTHPVSAKWTRLRVTNNGLIDTVYLRVIVYGVPSNSSLSAQISKIGNLNPEVDVGNLPYGYPNPNPRIVYDFNNVNTSLTSLNNVITLYPDLQIFHSGSSGAEITVNNNMLLLTTNNTKSLDRLYGRKCVLTNNNYLVRFNALWDYSSNSSLGGTALIGVSSQYGDVYAFGFGGVLTYDNWGIRYTISGGVVTVPRTSFNVDKCDGSLIVPVLDLTKVNHFQIMVSKTYVVFHVFHNGEYYPVHQVTASGFNIPLLRESSLGLYLQTFIDNSTVVTSGNLSVSVSYWSLMELGGLYIDSYIQNSNIVEIEKTITSTETYLCSLQNYTLYNSQSIFRANLVRAIKVIQVTETSSCVIRMYLNSTILAPSYSYINSHSNTRLDTVGSVSVYGHKTMSLPVDTIMELDQSYSFKPDDVITFTGQDNGAFSDDIILILYIE